jgi:hypothetical protein
MKYISLSKIEKRNMYKKLYSSSYIIDGDEVDEEDKEDEENEEDGENEED